MQTQASDNQSNHAHNPLWKDIERNKISHSVAHYLMAIDTIIKELHYCKAADIARKLQISRNAVSLRLNPLTQLQLISISDNKRISLTDSGKAVVNNIIAARRVSKKFLTDFLGVDSDIAEADSCKIEHLISDEMRDALLKLMQFTQEQKETSAPFLQAFKQFSLHCDGKCEPCNICHSECLIKQA